MNILESCLGLLQCAVFLGLLMELARLVITRKQKKKIPKVVLNMILFLALVMKN
jgi:hypothetical protein